MELNVGKRIIARPLSLLPLLRNECKKVAKTKTLRIYQVKMERRKKKTTGKPFSLSYKMKVVGIRLRETGKLTIHL